MPIQDAPPPPPAPVTEPAPAAPTPPQAPVTDSIGKKQPLEAPVSDAPRIQVGAQLANYLLLIVAGSIAVFVIYLVALDAVTSAEVTQVYNQTFSQMRGIAVPHDASGADESARILQSSSKAPGAPVGAADVRKVADVVGQLKKTERLTGQNATRLDQCVLLMTTPAIATPAAQMMPGAKQTTAPSQTKQPEAKGANAPSAPAPDAKDQPPQKNETAIQPPQPKQSPAPGSQTQEPAKQPAQKNETSTEATQKNDPGRGTAAQVTTADRAKILDECVQILDPLRQVSVSGAIDLDRLRLLKDYAKDAHEHRQAFRSFWLQAAQLVLLNLLLPLLTALLGYIFGSQVRS